MLTFSSLTFRCQWSTNTKLTILTSIFRSKSDYFTVLHHLQLFFDQVFQNQRIEWWFSILTWTIWLVIQRIISNLFSSSNSQIIQIDYKIWWNKNENTRTSWSKSSQKYLSVQLNTHITKQWNLDSYRFNHLWA